MASPVPRGSDGTTVPGVQAACVIGVQVGWAGGRSGAGGAEAGGFVANAEAGDASAGAGAGGLVTAHVGGPGGVSAGAAGAGGFVDQLGMAGGGSGAGAAGSAGVIWGAGVGGGVATLAAGAELVVSCPQVGITGSLAAGSSGRAGGSTG